MLHLRRNCREIAEVSVRDVQNKILEAGGYLLPYLDVPVDSPLFASLQRLGSTGIMKGVGRNVEWSNQTWFRADALLVKNEDVYKRQDKPQPHLLRLFPEHYVLP